MPQQLVAPCAHVPVHDRIPFDRRLPAAESAPPQAVGADSSHVFVMPVVREIPRPALDAACANDW